MRIAFYGDSLTTGVPGVPFFPELESMLPEDVLANLGRGGDTVISLYRRIDRGRARVPADVAVLWVGVNDILAKLSRSHTSLKWLRHQPPARDYTEFEAYYQRTVAHLQRRVRHVLAVSPLLIGEDLGNPWNRELDALRDIAASVAACSGNVCYLDLHKRFSSRLGNEEVSAYVPKSVTVIALEALFLRGPDWVDRASARRGLHLTLDGVHLNSVGARVVAEDFRNQLLNLRD